MKVLNTLFLEAMALSSASASCSERGSLKRPSGSESLRRMLPGTMASMSAARVAKPSSLSMAFCSSESGPMWRPLKASCCSRVLRGVRAVMFGAGSLGLRRAREGPAVYKVRSWSLQPTSVGFVRQELLVGLGVHQAVHVLGVGDLELHEPGAIGILVDHLGGVVQGFVAFRHFARDGAVDVGCRLHRLHHRETLASLEAAAFLRRFHEHEVAERRLGVVGDADGGDAVGAELHPLMALGVLQVSGNLAHLASPEFKP